MPALRVLASTGQRHLAREGFERERRRGRRVQPSRVQRPEGIPWVAFGGSAQVGAHRRGEQGGRQRESASGDGEGARGVRRVARLHTARCALHGPHLLTTEFEIPTRARSSSSSPSALSAAPALENRPKSCGRPVDQTTPQTPRLQRAESIRRVTCARMSSSSYGSDSWSFSRSTTAGSIVSPAAVQRAGPGQQG